MDKVCRTCGNLNHLEKECKSEARCLKCGKQQHPRLDCENSCLNCGGLHPCNSELCPNVAEKTYSMNKYTLDILIGEKLIKNKDEILRIPRQTLENKVIPLDADDKNLEKLIEGCISKRLVEMDIKFNTIKEANDSNKKEIENVKKDVNNVKSELGGLKMDLSTVKDDLAGVKQDIVDVKKDIGNVKKGLDDVKQDLININYEIDLVNKKLDGNHEELKAILLGIAKSNSTNKQ
ncbi:unnamed protein product [Brachionus calyciflorus]|uniref:CCHC-type domain-containing protein n=1 Tax=Brachionus calyciflorus TaxID=104777 RepID=A0A814HK57_9BILA|nr:unnamed protein product [Brachionus calyciflorus]